MVLGTFAIVYEETWGELKFKGAVWIIIGCIFWSYAISGFFMDFQKNFNMMNIANATWNVFDLITTIGDGDALPSSSIGLTLMMPMF